MASLSNSLSLRSFPLLGATGKFDLAALSFAQNWEEAADADGFADHPQLEHWFDPRFLVATSGFDSGHRVTGWASLKDSSVRFQGALTAGEILDTGPYLRRKNGTALSTVTEGSSGLFNAPLTDEARFIGPADANGAASNGEISLIGLTPIAPPYTIFAVAYNFDYLVSNGQKQLITKIDGVTSTDILYYANVNRYCFKRDFRIADDGQPQVTSNGVHLMMFEVDPANNRVTSWLNDPDTGYTETNSPLNTTGSINNGMTITPQTTTHSLGEFGFFSGKLSAQDRTDLFNRIKSRNGIS